MKVLKILALSLCIILIGLTVVLAEEASVTSGSDNPSNKSLDKVRRSNYGACVSAQTRVKSLCFRTKMLEYRKCERQVRLEFRTERVKEGVNLSILLNQIKEKSKACKTNYRTGLKECIVAFNASRQSCDIWKTPPNRTIEICTCPQGYKKEGSTCNPECYYSTPPCLAPSISCQKRTSRTQLNSETCAAGGGRWNECGSRCVIINQGKEGVACPAMCESLCECGTIAGLTCPAGYSCNMPSGVADAMGYCR